MIGTVYALYPQPPEQANTRYLPAGVLTIGVEYRDVDPESLRTTYEHDPDQLRTIEGDQPEGGFFDAGISLHVCGTDDGHEYLRFDCFDDAPHYHYIHRPGPGEEIANQILPFDTTANGDMLDWALQRLRTRLPEMLRSARGAHLVDKLDPNLLASVLDEAAEIAHQARREQRAAATP